MKCNGGDAHLLGRGGLRILPEETVQAQSHHTEECLTEDTTRHLARTLLPVFKNDGNLHNPEPEPVCIVLHLNLETVATHPDTVQVYGFQQSAGIALKTGSRIVNFHPKHKPYILRSEI